MNAATRFFRSDRWIPWTFVAFFAVVIAVNGVMIGFALSSWTGLMNDNAYRRGLAYNEKLDAQAIQTALGWHVAFEATSVEPLGARFIVEVHDRNGVAIDGADVTARLVRPTHDGYDSEAILDPIGGGRYIAAATFPMAGQWDIQLLVSHAGREHRSARRIAIR